MPKSFLILLSPGHNRLFMLAAVDAACAEAEALVPGCTAEQKIIGNVAYISVSGTQDFDYRPLLKLSLHHAVFEQVGELLKPLDCTSDRPLPDSLGTILKYPGKTNEQFTRMLFNLAGSTAKSTTCVLDPMCGQGTTLFEAAINGLDAIGVEQNEQSVKKAVDFFVKYLETAKIKHKLTSEKRSENGKKIANLSTVAYSLDRQKWKDGQSKFIKFFRADCLDTAKLLGKNSADVLVCDLPYGVQHGSKNGDVKVRNALSLMKLALPVWHSVLKSGAGVALSYNTLTTEREGLISLMENSGFTVDKNLSSGRLCHRVDSAIVRDVAVARRI